MCSLYILDIIRYMVGKYFLLSHRLTLQFVNFSSQYRSFYFRYSSTCLFLLLLLCTALTDQFQGTYSPCCLLCFTVSGDIYTWYMYIYVHIWHTYIYDKPRQHIRKQRHYFVNKGSSSQGYGFSSSHVWMWELDYKESCGLKNWCFRTVVLEKTLESPLDCKEIQPVHPKGNQSWIFFGRSDAEAETPILWPSD